MPSHTETDIRSMDGPTLDQLAYHLGLAPEGVEWDDEWFPHVHTPCWKDEHGILSPFTQPWQPHHILSQAEAVFRLLRKDGWSTYHEYHHHGDYGVIHVNLHNEIICEYWGEEYDNPSEALALLRVACQARMQQQGATA